MKEIRNIIFDLGGVVVDLDIETATKAFASLLVAPPHNQQEAVAYLRPLMHAMDRGEMAGTEFIATLKAACKPHVTDQQIMDAFNRIILMHRHRLEQIRQLRSHYRVFLLSNIGDLHWAETLRQSREMGIPIEECFDEFFLSYRLRMAKPDPRIFAHLIGATAIRPEETLYIDDLPDNIETGRSFGLQVQQIEMNTLDTVFPSLFPEMTNKI